MNVNRRTQAERSSATRATLVAAGRELWGARGYGAVGTPEIAEAAGVTRGALYHQFADKSALFLAVIESVEEDVMRRLLKHVARVAADATPADAIRAATDRWLAIAVEPEVRQLLLLDAPSVLGWTTFREIGRRHALGATEQMLAAAMAAGQLAPLPVQVLSHILVGAMDEAALVIATADDRAQALAEVSDVFGRLFDALFNET